MKFYYELRTWTLTKRDGWKSTFDDFDTLDDLFKHIEHMEKFVPVGVPECIVRTYDIRRLHKEVD
mgnify:CR=1 FL=1